MGIKFYPKVGSHIPVLMKLLLADFGTYSLGDVLEMGTGIYSTPFLHWTCEHLGLNLFSYESEANFYDYAKQFATDTHDIRKVENWDDADIERNWFIALIDHSPGKRRITDIMRIANYANYIVVHDTECRQDKHYNYKSIFPNFKYRRDFTNFGVQTTVLSNKFSLDGI